MVHEDDTPLLFCFGFTLILYIGLRLLCMKRRRVDILFLVVVLCEVFVFVGPNK